MLDLTGTNLGTLINTAVQALSPPSPLSPLASGAKAPNFAYSMNVTAQTTTYQSGTPLVIDYTNPPIITSYVPLAYIYDLTSGSDGYYQLLPDGYYSSTASAGQLAIWEAVAKQILQYISQNASLNVSDVSTIKDGYGRSCSGDIFDTSPGVIF
jgi:hypothetical protein